MTTLKILAGPRAYQHIQKNGLSPEDVSAVFGASGAAKWLTIYGLDTAIFSQWLPRSTHKIDLFGTSVGAFKLAAAALTDPTAALTRFAEAYINQDYVDKDIAAQVVIETENIIDSFLTPGSIEEILHNDRYNYHCGTVLCNGWMGSEQPTRLKLAMLKAFGLSALGRNYHRNMFSRCIFHSNGSLNSFAGADGFKTHSIALNSKNLRSAVKASGSIPVLMPGIMDIPGAPTGIHRDGGLLDYHAIPANLGVNGDGLVLYPHFYSVVKEGWFDKFWPWRKASAQQLDNTVLVAPSDEFVASLPGGRIPDRQDFQRFEKDDSERVRRWQIAMERSNELGEEFLALTDSGDIASHVELIS